MVNEEELPESIAERAKVMENTLIDAATGGPLDEDTYGHLPVSRLYRESLLSHIFSATAASEGLGNPVARAS